MSLFVDRLRKGFYLTSESFSFLWLHKRLVMYSALPISAGFIVHALMYNLVRCEPNSCVTLWSSIGELIRHSANFPTWLKHTGMFVLHFAYLIIITFFNCALIYHATHVIRQQPTSFLKSLRACLSKKNLIIRWAAIATVFVSLLRLPSLFNYSLSFIHHGQTGDKALSIVFPIALFVIALTLLWSLFTFFVVPIIALEHVIIQRAIRMSFFIARNTWIEIIGGGVFFGILAGLTVLPGIIFDYTSHATGTFLLIVYILTIASECILSAAHTLFAMLLYNKYYRDPIDQLEVLRYDI